MWVVRCYGRPLDGAERDNSEGVERLSHLQDCIMEYLRQHPEGATAKAIAEGIGSSGAVCRYSIRSLERFGLVESRRVGLGKIWRAIA
jgi:predicted transcriptional regulator